ncbi:MAG: hypothetical protein JXQ81_00915 [Desulfuromonadales bacterium]|nr:hypothetical protein [Desulfuromonadales bacterium]MBN2791045.1 hypothetical protein [Desulfuromonadales bacterium]
MRHGLQNSLLLDPWKIALIIIGLVLLVAGLIWLIHRRTVASDGLTPSERKNLSFQEKEILSMVRQHGGPMRQDWLVDELPGDSEDLAEVILEIENKGLIKREWQSDVGTYMVSTLSQSVVKE